MIIIDRPIFIVSSPYLLFADILKQNCKEIYDDNELSTSGIYEIDPRDGGYKVKVFCDMSVTSDKGWIVIQRRVNGSVDFDRNRHDYKYGFGQLDENFWLGLENIKRIIDSGSNGYELYMGMGEWNTPTPTESFARWKTFSLGTEANDWQLTITTATTGPDFTSSNGATNSMIVSDNQKFTTKDDDNDNRISSPTPTNCAVAFEGGWWYNNCLQANPNGHYYTSSANNGDYTGLMYRGLTGKSYSLKTTVLAIRPK